MDGTEQSNEVPHDVSPVRRRLKPPLRKQAIPYLSGLVVALLIIFGARNFQNPVHEDSLVLIAVLIICLIFTRLLKTFACRPGVRLLLLLAVSCLIASQSLELTEEISALDDIPVLGKSSTWNSELATFGNFAGFILLAGAITAAVVELGGARDNLVDTIQVRVRAEAELAAHRDHLQDQVAVRTVELQAAQEDLLAQERSQVLAGIMSTVSQELCNPLATIRESLHTISLGLESGETSQAEEAIQRCERNVIRCDHIIEELHDFSSAENFAPQLRPVDEWLTAFAATLTLPDSVRLETDLNANATTTLDAHRMDRALRHLLENSLEAMEELPEARRRILIESDRDATHCHIRIHDTGAGMTPESLERIAEPLFSTRSFGIGLGVPIAKETIRRHGGNLGYESVAGQGTVVTISLPLGHE